MHIELALLTAAKTAPQKSSRSGGEIVRHETGESEGKLIKEEAEEESDV